MKLGLIFFRGSLALMTLATSVLAAKSPGSREDLRRLLKLPQVTFSTGAFFGTEGQLRMLGARADWEAIEEARKELRGGPGDGLTWIKLGQLLKRAEDYKAADKAFSNAVPLLRAQVEQRPQDGRLVGLLGEALGELEQDQEAESVLRRGVQLAPGEGETWLGLAGFLNSRCSLALLPPGMRQLPGGESFAEVFGKYKPSAEQFEKAERLQAEALKCLHSAVGLMSNNPAVYERRAGCRMAGQLLGYIKRNVAARKPDWDGFAGVLFNTESLADLQRAVELEMDDPIRLAAVVYYEVFTSSMERSGGKATEQAMAGMKALLSTDATRPIRTKLARLNELAASPDKVKAAAAAEALGCISVMGLGDFQAAEGHFRRATTLDARRELAWDGLMLSLSERQRYSEYLAGAEQRLKTKASGRNYVLAAKACEKLKRPREAVQQARAGVKVAPQEFLPRLTLAAALIQENDSRENLEEAGKHLNKALDLVEYASGEEKGDLGFTVGIFLALTGQLESAREAFEKLSKADPENEDVKAALSILKKW